MVYRIQILKWQRHRVKELNVLQLVLVLYLFCQFFALSVLIKPKRVNYMTFGRKCCYLYCNCQILWNVKLYWLVQSSLLHSQQGVQKIVTASFFLIFLSKIVNQHNIKKTIPRYAMEEACKFIFYTFLCDDFEDCFIIGNDILCYSCLYLDCFFIQFTRMIVRFMEILY